MIHGLIGWWRANAPAILSFVLVGLRLANVFPLAIAQAGLLGDARGVARASTVGYTGLLGGGRTFTNLAGQVSVWRKP